MVRAGKAGRSEGEFLAHLRSLVSPAGAPAVWRLAGDPLVEKWPEDWAGEAAALALQAYGPLDRSGLELSVDGRISGQIAFDVPAYKTQFGPTANRQLAVAGFRLAALLNAVWP